MIQNKSMAQWCAEYPTIKKLQALEGTFWINPKKLPIKEAVDQVDLTMEDILDASARWERFASYLMVAFPETQVSNGILESPLKWVSDFQECIAEDKGMMLPGEWWVKCDSHLPISGSIKARGGIYEVLYHAEQIAMREGGLQITDDYAVLAKKRFAELFSRYSIAVGSTGNLGLSIGIMSAKLGFKVTVHMSADARAWKKEMLRSKGVTVIEYEQDYSKAVKEGRLQAGKDPYCYFIDDENSKTLFLGYSVAALRLKEQLKENDIIVNQTHPLFVYLPCGVGGGPGGVAFGLKMVFGNAVHCFFAEPTHSPCMILGMVTGYHSQISVQDFGIDNKTIADGLAVGRASGFVGTLMEPLLSGCYTVSDEQMYRFLAQLADTENLYVEPSALAGVMGPVWLAGKEGRPYLEQHGFIGQLHNCTHLIWATGGNMVPADVMQDYYTKGKELL